MIPRPSPVPQNVTCSVCHLDWAEHESDAKGNVSVSECVRLLRDALDDAIASKSLWVRDTYMPVPYAPMPYVPYPTTYPTIISSSVSDEMMCGCGQWVKNGTSHRCGRTSYITTTNNLSSGVTFTVLQGGQGSEEDPPPQRAGVPA